MYPKRAHGPLLERWCLFVSEHPVGVIREMPLIKNRALNRVNTVYIIIGIGGRNLNRFWTFSEFRACPKFECLSYMIYKFKVLIKMLVLPLIIGI